MINALAHVVLCASPPTNSFPALLASSTFL